MRKAKQTPSHKRPESFRGTPQGFGAASPYFDEHIQVIPNSCEFFLNFRNFSHV
jgi:hypothetical protein